MYQNYAKRMAGALVGLPLAALMAFASADSIRMDASSSEEVIAGLRADLAELVEQSEAIINKADEEGRDLTEEEVTEITDLRAKADSVNKQISARESVVRISAGTGRRTAHDVQPGGTQARDSVPAQPRGRDTNRGGFESFGHFSMAVRNAAVGADPDNRLRASANEGTGADGGFIVPPDFRREIWEKVVGEESLLSRTDQLVTGGNSMTIPKDETTPWETGKGVQVFWESEQSKIRESGVHFEPASMRLNKLTGLVAVTEELLEDAPGIDSYLRSKAPQKMAAKLNTAIIRGTGVGQPKGILSAPSLITIPKASSQPADTVLYENIVKMWARLYAPLRRNAVWLINQDVEPQLDLMQFAPGSSTPVPVYLPQGGASATPFALLKGRPVIPVEACSTLGDVGDIILTDLTQYMTLSKGQNIRTDVSMHLLFDKDMTAFKFVFRITGQPWWGRELQPQNGTMTRSWAVALEERA